jgi:hypothetical protein
VAEVTTLPREAAPPTPTAPTAPRPHCWRRRLPRVGLYALLVLFVLGMAALIVPFRYAYEPAPDKVLNEAAAHPAPAYDVWGRAVAHDEAEQLSRTGEGRRLLDPANGAVRIDGEVLKLGRRAFYEETFGNEVFLTEVLGLLDGPLTLPAVVEAILDLKGEATINLRVKLARDATIAGRPFPKGTVIDTGLDVPKGALAPLGMRVVKRGKRVRVGITRALCHSTVDPAAGKVIHGAPNSDLNAGLMLALASNSAAYFAHADAADLAAGALDPNRTVATSDGRHVALPDPQALEDAVDARLMAWPPGSFDSMIDLVGAPSKLPCTTAVSPRAPTRTS